MADALESHVEFIVTGAGRPVHTGPKFCRGLRRASMAGNCDQVEAHQCWTLMSTSVYRRYSGASIPSTNDRRAPLTSLDASIDVELYTIGYRTWRPGRISEGR